MSTIQQENIRHIRKKYEKLMGIAPTMLYVGYKTWMDIKTDLLSGEIIWKEGERPHVYGLDVYLVDDVVHLNVG